MSKIWRIFLIVLVVLLTLLPLHSGGTGDVAIWQGWIEAIERDGFITGYIPVYPPLTWTILLGVSYAYHALNIEMLLAIKWALVFFLFLTSGIFLLWTRNLLLTVFFHISLILSSVALGYLDIWVAPALLLSLWALKERKIFLCTLFFTIAWLVKWQPLIIAPFIMAYIVRPTGIKQWKETVKIVLRDVLLPAGLLVGLMVLLFGQGLLISLQDGMGHTGLTGNALNYNWLVTFFLSSTQPDRFGALANGIVNYIGITEWEPGDWPLVLIPRVLFGLFYVSGLVFMLRKAATFENFIRFVIVGYMAYCTFNIGVHENHFFMAGLLAVVLYWLSSRELYSALVIVLIANINLFLFYGLNGSYPYDRIIGMDISVPLALFNVIFFIAFWAISGWQKPVVADENTSKRIPQP